MKKLILATGAVLVVVLAAMVITPMVVDVDKYRPQIVNAANEKLNGHLELGHLQLSLWGHVRIEAQGLALKDAHDAEVVGVKSASFLLPLFPLLAGSPVIDLQMEAPVINVVKNRAGKLNLLSLLKSSAQTQGGAGVPAQPAQGQQPPQPKAPTPSTTAPSSSQSVAVPAIAARARIGVQLLNANVKYKDESTGFVTEMSDLNFVVKSLSLSHTSEIAIWSDFKTQMGKSLFVNGPGRVDLTFKPETSGGKLSRFSLTGKANFDDLEISSPGVFQKSKGVAANLSAILSGSEAEIKIEKLDLNFFNAQIKSGGEISNLGATPSLRYSIRSNDISLKDWVELLPMLKEYQLGGTASLSATLGGQVEKITYEAKLALDSVTAKSPKLKSQPKIDGQIVIATDQIQNLLLTLRAPGNELKVSGKVVSFKAPQVSLDITSPGMDLDQLIDFQAASSKSARAAELVSSAYAETTEKAPQDYDALLAPLRENKMLAATTASVNFDLKMLKAQGIRMDNVAGRLFFKDLAAALDNFTMTLFNGTVKAKLVSQLQPKVPTYKFSANVIGLDLAEAVKSQVKMFQNTLTGKAGFEVLGEGASFNPEPAKSNLKAKGSMKISGAQFSTLDIGKMVVDGIQSAISKVASKVPGMAGKSFNPPNITSKYQMISSDFGIQAGKFNAPNFTGKAVPNQGFDLKGSVVVGLKDQSLDAKFQIMDTYNLTHAKDLASGMLVEKGKPFTMPVGAGCTLSKPCYSYGETAEFLAKIAMNNALGQAKKQVQSQIQNELQKALGGHGGGTPDIGGALKNLFGH